MIESLATAPTGSGEPNAQLPLSSPSFLLCPPDHFGIEYEINPFMHTHEAVDLPLAQQQWQALREALQQAGAHVLEQPPAKGLPDLVFTNNAGMISGDRALLSRFRHVERQGETAHNEAALRALGFKVEHLPESAGTFEGAADALCFDTYVVCAWGPRTSREAAPHIAKFSGKTALSVQLVDPRLYHLDMTFCRISEQTALVAPMAYDPAGLEGVLSIVPDPILLTDEEALGFCGNAIAIESTVFMHQVPERLRSELQKRGYEARSIDVGEFTKAGGSVCCLSLRLA